MGRPRCACSRCEDIGRKKPCAVNEGICVLLIRLAALPGLLAIWLDAATELLAGGGPRRDTEGCERGGCDDHAVLDRSGSPSPSSEVTRDDIPPTEGGRGIPRPCCEGGGLPVSRDSGYSDVLAMMNVF